MTIDEPVTPKPVPTLFEWIGGMRALERLFETFYARCAEVFAAPGPPDFARIGAISREHGYDIIRGG